jgi:hypothetical protein
MTRLVSPARLARQQQSSSSAGSSASTSTSSLIAGEPGPGAAATANSLTSRNHDNLSDEDRGGNVHGNHGGANPQSHQSRPTSSALSAGGGHSAGQQQPSQQQQQQPSQRHTQRPSPARPMDSAGSTYSDLYANDPEDPDAETHAMATEGLSPEALARYWRAHAASTRRRLDGALAEADTLRRRVMSLDVDAATHADDAAAWVRERKALGAQIDKLRDAAGQHSARRDGAESRTEKLRLEIEELTRAHRRSENEARDREAKLARALEEVERYRGRLRDAQGAGREGGDQARRDAERLTAENKRLERQKSELVAAFKKQQRLIDVLKRQKLHIEAAKLLSFTEEEFSKAVELGDHM